MLSSNHELSQVGQSTIYRKYYFIYPSDIITYRTKKTLTSTMNATVSYLAVRGNDLRFNITLKTCVTFNCSDERLALRDIVIDDDDSPQ